MHNYIIQLEPNPIHVEEFINVLDIPKWFVNSIADYVIDVDYLDDAFANILEGWNTQYVLSHDARVVTFGPNFKKEHFKDKHQRLLNLISDLDGVPMTLDDFCNCGTAWHLKNEFDEIITDEYGLWVFTGDDIIPFDRFVRTMEPERSYYVGNILDYHM